MFHVKTQMKKVFFRKHILVLFLSFYSYNCFSQKAGDFSIGVSCDYGFGVINNYASTLRANYNLLDKLRISPSYSYYIVRDDTKMQSFSLNLHYICTEMLYNVLPIIKESDINIYPVAGIVVSNRSHPKNRCNSCSVSAGPIGGYSYALNFGLDIGAGVEYKLPTLQPILRDASLCFEVQYHILDGYERTLFAFGINYKF